MLTDKWRDVLEIKMIMKNEDEDLVSDSPISSSFLAAA